MTDDEIDAKVIGLKNCLRKLNDFKVIHPKQFKNIMTKIGAWGYDRMKENKEEIKL